MNGRRRCGVCHALLIYRPSERTRVIDCRGVTAFLWHPDELGSERIIAREVVLDGDQERLRVHTERGVWLPLGQRVLRITRPDRRRAGLREYLPSERRLRYA